MEGQCLAGERHIIGIDLDAGSGTHIEAVSGLGEAPTGGNLTRARELGEGKRSGAERDRVVGGEHPASVGIGRPLLDEGEYAGRDLGGVVGIRGTRPRTGGHDVDAVGRGRRLVLYQHAVTGDDRYTVDRLRGRERDVGGGGSAHRILDVEALPRRIDIGLGSRILRGRRIGKIADLLGIEG